MTRGRRDGFTLLELALTLALVGLMVALVVPRLGVLRSAELDSSASRLATRIRYLREEAALRNRWIRLAVDTREGRYRAEALVEVEGGARFVPDERPLFRAVALPSDLRVALDGAGVVSTPDGWLATLFAPDGFADPAVVRLDDGAGRILSVVIEPTTTKARVVEGAVDAPRAELLP